MSVFEANREAAFSFFYLIFVSVGKYCPFFLGGGGGNEKNGKKVAIRTFLNHPAATPETEVFFSMA